MKSEPVLKRFALIEFGSSHDECLLTQVVALKKNGHYVVLVTNEILRKRNARLNEWVDEWLAIDPRNSSDQGNGLTGAAIGDALIVRRLMRHLKKINIDTVVFNTAQGGHVRNACLFSLFRKTKCAGIVHTIRKFQGSFTQRLIHLKIKHYFVLAEFLKDQIPSQKKIQVTAFYPLHFPTPLPISYQKNGPIHIAIIGSVETRRKDLNGFVEMIQHCDPEVTFSFLGKAEEENVDVQKLKQSLVDIGCLDRVTFYDNRVNFELMDQILRKSSAILTLIHPNTPSADQYFRNQIPGAMNVALAYKIPLFVHESFSKIDELKTAAIYYSLHDFQAGIEAIKMKGEDIHLAMIEHEKYSASFHEKTFADGVLVK